MDKDNETEQLRLSVSKTKTYEGCAKQFYFTYIQKLQRKERDYHITGKFCHEILENFHLAYINGSILPFNQEMGKAYKAARIAYGEKMTQEMLNECREIIDNYLRLISISNTGYNTVQNVLAVEKEFFIDIGHNVALNGLIDRVQMDDDGIIHVADYKTTKKGAKYLRKDFGQLLTYAYTIFQENPTLTKIRASYILLRHNFEWITTEFDIDEIMSVKEKYLQYARLIRNEIEYKANPTVLCGWCDHLEICSEGKAKVQPQNIKHGQIGW